MTAVWEEGTGEENEGVGSGQLVQWEGSSKVLTACTFVLERIITK